jgi:hypothetical protein
LARRLLSTFRPSGVAILALNPWVRFRRTFDGWYVRFMINSPPNQKLAIRLFQVARCQRIPILISCG